MKAIFRNAMFGFHKGDVNSFISKQSKQYEKKLAEAVEELSRKEASFEAEKSELLQQVEKLEAKQHVAEENCKKFERALHLAKQISEESHKLTDSVAKTESGLAQMQENSNYLRAELAEARRYRDKAQKFDQLKGVLSGILSDREVPESAETAPCRDVDTAILSEEKLLSVAEEKEAALRLSAFCQELLDLLQSEEANS